MNWFAWTLVLLIAASTVNNVAGIGKPREPVTPGLAAIVVVINGLIIAGLFYYCGACH